MINVVANAKAPFDHLGHPGAGPQIGVIARGLGTLEQERFELAAVLSLKFRRPPRGRFCAHPCFPLSASGCLPAPHAAPIYANALGNLDGLKSFFEQRQRAHTTMFEFFWASGWPHRAPPDRSIGYYLRRI